MNIPNKPNFLLVFEVPYMKDSHNAITITSESFQWRQTSDLKNKNARNQP